MTRIVPLAQIHNGGWGEAQGVASALIGIRIVQQIPQLLQWNHQKHLIIKKVQPGSTKKHMERGRSFSRPILLVIPSANFSAGEDHQVSDWELRGSILKTNMGPRWPRTFPAHQMWLWVKNGQTCSQCGFQVGESQHKPSHFGWLQY